MVKVEATPVAAAPAAAAPSDPGCAASGVPVLGSLEQNFLACAPAKMPPGPLLMQRSEDSFEPTTKEEYILFEPVHEPKERDATVWMMVYNVIFAAVFQSLPKTLPSSPWAGVRAVDLIPHLPVNMTYRTLVRFIEAGFHKIDAVSGQIFRIYAFMLEHPVLNPEGNANDFSHFFPPGYYLNVIPMTKLIALSENDSFKMSKKMRVTDPSGRLSCPDDEAEAMRRISQPGASTTGKAPANKLLHIHIP